MSQYIAGFVTALLLCLVGVIIYLVRTKNLREKVTSLEAKAKIKEVIYEKFKNEILEHKLPDNADDILKRLDELKGPD